MRKVLAVTGIRSEYDILFPVIKRLANDPRFRLKLVISGAHLSAWHGDALKRIEHDGFEVADKIDSLYMTDRETQRVKGIGSLVTGLAQTVEREQPDILFVVGDREESIGTALVGNYMNVLVGHVGGGDPVYGNSDDPIRCAVSKLAHIHFTTTASYADNLKQMGEEQFRIFHSGNPALDHIRQTELMDMGQLCKQLSYDLNSKQYVVLINHPLSSEKLEVKEQMRILLDGLATFVGQSGFRVVASYPNTDPGCYGILSEIDRVRGNSAFRFYDHLPRVVFVNLMRNAAALVGNSSMGLLEAPYYRLPVVNVGNRQQGRLNAGNVEFVPHQETSIVMALKKACFDEAYRSEVSKLPNPYGDGHASELIVDTLASVDVTEERWYVKKDLCGRSPDAWLERI